MDVMSQERIFQVVPFEFTDNSRCFFPFPHKMKDMEKDNLSV